MSKKQSNTSASETATRGVSKSNALGMVGQNIRSLRKEMGWSLKDLAEKSSVTPGLISRIENFRTIPSLPVLHHIAVALQVPLSDLVENIDANENPYILTRKGEGETEDRDDSEGLEYVSLLSQPIGDSTIRVNMVTVNPLTYRPPNSNDGMELLYVIKGDIEYGIGEELVPLNEGDTLYFNGKIPHSLNNKTSSTVILFKVYFLKP